MDGSTPVTSAGSMRTGSSGQVKNMPGALGYVELTYAVTNRLSVAAIRNRVGAFVMPTVESTVAAAAAIAAGGAPSDFPASECSPMGWLTWIDGPGWERQIGYEPDALVTDVTLNHRQLGLTAHARDAVDFDENVYVREITVSNLLSRPREVRLFFHQDFHLYGSEVADTELSWSHAEFVSAVRDYLDKRRQLLEAAS
jgi:hypothetical protein